EPAAGARGGAEAAARRRRHRGARRAHLRREARGARRALGLDRDVPVGAMGEGFTGRSSPHTLDESTWAGVIIESAGRESSSGTLVGGGTASRSWSASLRRRIVSPPSPGTLSVSSSPSNW